MKTGRRRYCRFRIQARWDNVVDTRLCTVIGNKDGVVVVKIVASGSDLYKNDLSEEEAPEVAEFEESEEA